MAVRRLFGSNAQGQHLVPVVGQGQLDPSLFAIEIDTVNLNAAGAAFELEVLAVEDVEDPIRSLPRHEQQ